MARPLSGDIWHLSIDDLLAPLPEAPRLGGAGPFVINLSASTAPIGQPVKGVVGCRNAHVYQIQRTEDRRLRYRLRLGPFATEEEAVAALEEVRDIYPGALTATAEGEDLRALQAIQAKIAAQTRPTSRPKVDVQPKADVSVAIDRAQPPLATIPVLSEAVSPVRPASVRPPLPGKLPPQVARTLNNPVAAPAAAPEAKPWVVEPPLMQPSIAQPSVLAKPSEVKPQGVKPPLPQELPLQIPPAASEVAPAAAPDAIPWVVEPPAQPSAVKSLLHRELPLQIPPAAVEVAPAAAPDAIPWVIEPPPLDKPPEAKQSMTRPSVVRPLPIKPSPVPAAAKPVEQIAASLASFESTQTIRPLTPLELQDEAGSRWFVIQLSIAEQAFDPDRLPNLDIFSVYRLYSVAGLDQGRVMHALRLGFFSDENAAGAVASYLTTFYQGSAVKRVSAAERQRFADQCFEARKDVGATGQHAAIEITSDRVVRETRAATTASAQKSADPPGAPPMVAQKSRWF